jgi:AraC-like DNA-binding protein
VPPGHRLQLLASALPSVEVVLANSDRPFARHTHEHFGMGLITGGAQRSASGRGMVEAGAGDLITVNPGEVHDGVPIGDTGRCWQMLYVDPALVQSMRAEAGGDGPVPLDEFKQPALRDLRLAALFGRCFAALTTRASGTGRLAADEALVRLLAPLLQARPPGPAPMPAGLAHARRWIDDEPTAALSLDLLAQAAGLSRWQFVRGFARAFGITPHAYVLQRRAHLARRCIAGGSSLAEAAALSGFADQSHMTRVFVRSFGFAPGAYARVRAPARRRA